MRFTPLAIDGAWSIQVEANADDRGFFARTWCREEFVAHGIAHGMVQASVSFNHRAGTLRGMHFSWPPAREGKLVSCNRGRIHDVLLDLRPASPSFGMHDSVELDPGRHDAVYVPPGVAHGFQTLADACEVHYMMTQTHLPQHAGGVRYDDPAFGIRWPLPVSAIAERDRICPDFDPEAHRARFLRSAKA